MLSDKTDDLCKILELKSDELVQAEAGLSVILLDIG